VATRDTSTTVIGHLMHIDIEVTNLLSLLCMISYFQQRGPALVTKSLDDVLTVQHLEALVSISRSLFTIIRAKF